ncbi:MAG TPA: hypothetical protein VHM88_08665, partial [Candidatus Acidoferrales bacterium]|nr:hypothetical protein [Candidatus Acidoferrales bacterium]
LFSTFAACLRARVVEVSNDGVKLASDDTFSEVTLPITEGLIFEYADPRDFPEEAELFRRGLAIVIPTREAEPDRIIFLELTESALRP